VAVIRKRIITKIGIYILWLPLILTAQPPQTVWVTVDTFKVFDENTSLAEARNRTIAFARQEAIRRAVPEEIHNVSLITDKQAQTGKAAEEQTAYSIFAMATQSGMIIEEKIESCQPTFRDNMLYYRVRLCARIQPVQGERNPALALELGVNSMTLKNGEKLMITVQANHDGYLYLFDFLSDNSVQLMFPNSDSKNNLIAANKRFTLPTPAETAQGIYYKVTARPDMQVTAETIYAVFCLSPIAGIDKFSSIQKGYATFTAGDESFTQFQRWLAAVPLSQRVEKAIPIHIVK